MAMTTPDPNQPSESEKATEQATEEIARRISQDQTGSEAMWELFLQEAYKEYYRL